MRISVVKETRAGENRVAASPETVKKLSNLGIDVVVEAGAGAASSFMDDDYESAGASIARDLKTAVSNADLILKVQKPGYKGDKSAEDELKQYPKGSTVIGILSPLSDADQFESYNKLNITSISMDMIPRITRAQSMDVLSSQANLGGYRAVIEAVSEFKRALPMMMTAAGTIPPAKVLVLGAGVAGLQAIATAKRLGAVVSAFDVRAAVKEQVESLGATFVEVEETADAETAGGYAKEMSEDYKKKQAQKIKETLAKSDIAITTALIPGRPAPLLIPEDMVEGMKPGSIIVDMAVEMGGNCAVSQLDQIVDHRGVKVIGHRNLPSRIPQDASRLYARNIMAFLEQIIDKESLSLKLDRDDEIIKNTLLTQGGSTVHEQFSK